MTQTIHTAADDTLSPVRALRSLTSAQAGQIVAGLSSLAGTWDIGDCQEFRVRADRLSLIRPSRG